MADSVLGLIQSKITNPLLGGTAHPNGTLQTFAQPEPGNSGPWNPSYQPAITSSYNAQAAAQAAAQARANAQAAAQYDQSINNTQAAINRLGAQQDSGYGAIDSSYQNALNQLLLSKNQGQTTYNTNKQQTATDYVGAKNTIGANAGSTLNGLLRLLGSRGAGGSSAATVSAPGAVARQATLQRADAGNTNAQNNQALDTNWGNFMTGYNNQVSSAGNQKDQQRQSLEQQIANNRATLLQTLAQLSGQRAQAAGGNPVGAAQPYLDQANAVLDRASSYSTAPINYQTQAYQAPSLASYQTNQGAAPTYQGQTQGNDYFSPYLQALLGKKQLTTA